MCRRLSSRRRSVHRSVWAVSHVQRLLGSTVATEGISSELVERFLRALGCELTPESDDVYIVRLPSWRLDLTREIDLIEEIARVYGYNRFGNTLPTSGVVEAHPLARAQRAIRDRLYSLGFSEAISSTFASASEAKLFAPAMSPVALENPLSDEASNLRPSLLAGMTTMLAHNLNRDVLDVRLFELGAVFTGSSAEVLETTSLALGLTGTGPEAPPYSSKDAPFFELKGVLEALAGLFAVPSVVFTHESIPSLYEPGRAASLMIDGQPLASFGQVAVDEAARRKLRQPIYLAELDLALLLRFPLRQAIAREISRYQAVERDFSFTFPEGVLWSSITEAIQSLEIEDLRSLQPAEIWRNESKHPGVFSMLIRTVFSSAGQDVAR